MPKRKTRKKSRRKTRKRSTYRRRRTHTRRKSKRKRKTRKSRKSPKKRKTRKSHKKRKTRKITIKKRIPKGKRCSDLLSNKIRINMKEYKKGKYVSRAQAIAVAYSQVRKEYPSCKPVFTKKRKTSKKRKRLSL